MPDPNTSLDPEPDASTPAGISPARLRRQRRRRVRRIAVTAVVAVVIAGLAVGITWASLRPSGTAYRTAIVSHGAVDQTVSAVGALADVNTADAAFAVAGTVEKVDVAVGQAVKAGQVLGTLDPTQLTSAVHTAETDLATARQTLADDTDAQASAADESASASTAAPSQAASGQGAGGGAGAAASTSATTAVSSPRATSPGGAAGSSSGAQGGEITAVQRAIVGCQQQLDYLIGKGVTAGTCTPAPTAASGPPASGGASSQSGVRPSTGARRPAAASGGGSAAGSGSSAGHGSASPASGAGSSQAPVSQQCAAILSASGNGGASGAGGPSSDASPATTVTVAGEPSTVTVMAPPVTTTATATETTTATATTTETTTQTTTVIAPPLRGTAAPALVSPTTDHASADQQSVDSPASTSAQTASPANAVTACQSAITGAIDALHDLYSWELSLDSLLESAQQTGASGAAGRTAAGDASHPSTGKKVTSQTGRTTGAGTGTAATSGSGAGTGTGLTGSSRAGVGSQAMTVPTAADISADQARIDLQEADLAVAEQNAKGASLVSPIGGTVGKVAITAGDRVTAGSSTETITVLGRRQYQITTSIPLSDIGLIKAGQRVSIDVDGVATPLTGSVTMIGVLDNSSTSTPSYPVTVAVDPTSQTLFNGAGAALTVDIGSAAGVLTVPTSAVTTSGTRHTVTVLDHGTTSIVAVQVGLVGPSLTQITSGLTAGQVVVLADVDQALPTSSAGAGFGRIAGGGGGLGGGAGRVLSGGGAARLGG